MPDEQAPPHDDRTDEPLGPFTPDDETPAGDTPEVHDRDLSPHDLPKDHPGRQEAERLADASDDGLASGNT